VLKDWIQRLVERGQRIDLFVGSASRRTPAVGCRQTQIGLEAGQMGHELRRCGSSSGWRSSVYRQLPSAESAMAGLSFGGGQRRESNLSADRRVLRLRLIPGVRPISHEYRLSTLKNAPRILLGSGLD